MKSDRIGCATFVRKFRLPCFKECQSTAYVSIQSSIIRGGMTIAIATMVCGIIPTRKEIVKCTSHSPKSSRAGRKFSKTHLQSITWPERPQPLAATFLHYDDR